MCEGLSYVFQDGALAIELTGTVLEQCVNKSKVLRLTIKEGPSAIGESAFAGQEELTDVTLGPDMLTIGAYAFSGCASLSAIQLPEGLESIGEAAFLYSGLTEI
jgi:hypothetical protein